MDERQRRAWMEEIKSHGKRCGDTGEIREHYIILKEIMKKDLPEEIRLYAFETLIRLASESSIYTTECIYSRLILCSEIVTDQGYPPSLREKAAKILLRNIFPGFSTYYDPGFGRHNTFVFNALTDIINNQLLPIPLRKEGVYAHIRSIAREGDYQRLENPEKYRTELRAHGVAEETIPEDLDDVIKAAWMKAIKVTISEKYFNRKLMEKYITEKNLLKEFKELINNSYCRAARRHDFRAFSVLWDLVNKGGIKHQKTAEGDYEICQECTERAVRAAFNELIADVPEDDKTDQYFEYMEHADKFPPELTKALVDGALWKLKKKYCGNIKSHVCLYGHVHEYVASVNRILSNDKIPAEVREGVISKLEQIKKANGLELKNPTEKDGETVDAPKFTKRPVHAKPESKPVDKGPKKGTNNSEH